jgi:hypothetical protein
MPKRKKKALSPEPGGWVLDPADGLPAVTPPGDLPEGLISSQELRDQWVAYEGLGFCVYSLIPVRKLDDAELRALWRKARQAMQDIVDYLEEA